MVKYLIFILSIVVVVSCKKPSDRTCFKSTGEVITMDTLLGGFDSLALYDDLEYYIVPDSIEKLRIVGGENLVKHIRVVNEQNGLTIANDNKCNFLRGLNQKVKVYIHSPEINHIYYEGSERLESTDTLKAAELRLLVRDGAGRIDLTVENGYTSAVVSHGWGDFTLRGQTISAFLNCSTNSYCDTRSLNVITTLHVNSNTQGDMYVNAEGTEFKCTIHQRGNIYYTGNPVSTDFTYNDQGDIIHLTN